MFGLYALSGALLGGALLYACGSVAAQWIMQRNENERALWKLAYEGGMLEWRTSVENKLITPVGFQNADEFIKSHLVEVSLLYREYSPEDHRDIKTLRKHLKDLLAEREARAAFEAGREA
jgi:hypothetical protein